MKYLKLKFRGGGVLVPTKGNKKKLFETTITMDVKGKPKTFSAYNLLLPNTVSGILGYLKGEQLPKKEKTETFPDGTKLVVLDNSWKETVTTRYKKVWADPPTYMDGTLDESEGPNFEFRDIISDVFGTNISETIHERIFKNKNETLTTDQVSAIRRLYNESLGTNCQFIKDFLEKRLEPTMKSFEEGDLSCQTIEFVWTDETIEVVRRVFERIKNGYVVSEPRASKFMQGTKKWKKKDLVPDVFCGSDTVYKVDFDLYIPVEDDTMDKVLNGPMMAYWNKGIVEPSFVTEYEYEMSLNGERIVVKK